MAAAVGVANEAVGAMLVAVTMGVAGIVAATGGAVEAGGMVEVEAERVCWCCAIRARMLTGWREWKASLLPNRADRTALTIALRPGCEYGTAGRDTDCCGTDATTAAAPLVSVRGIVAT